MSASERNIHLGLLGVSLTLAVWVFGGQRHAAEPATRGHALSKATPERSPVSMLPAGSTFVLSADLRALGRAPIGAFLAGRLGRTAGASKLAQVCGFDPLTRLDQFALAIPSANFAAQVPPDFGIVASGAFSAAELTRCASATIAARGGEAIQGKRGRFDTVRDSKASSGEMAAKDGLVVVSDGSYFRELLDAAESSSGRGAPEVRDARHAKLRRALGPAPLLVTWLLGEGWLERLTGGETNARLSPLSALKTVGARIDVGQTANLLVLLECADSEGATRIAGLLSEWRSSLELLPLDPTLLTLAARIKVNQSGASLKLSLELNQAELTPVLDTLDR